MGKWGCFKANQDSGGERKKVLYTHSKLGKITVAWDRRGRELGRLFSCRRNGVFGLTARFGSEGGESRPSAGELQGHELTLQLSCAFINGDGMERRTRTASAKGFLGIVFGF